jgi:hypothetical protein
VNVFEEITIIDLRDGANEVTLYDYTDRERSSLNRLNELCICLEYSGRIFLLLDDCDGLWHSRYEHSSLVVVLWFAIVKIMTYYETIIATMIFSMITTWF